MSGKTSYQPPYTITPIIMNRVAEVSEAIGRLSVVTDQARALRLRRINRIRTIRGSLAIEGNTLSEAQITAILDGKRVIAPPREVQEVRNALAAYACFDTWRPEAEKDLLEAHRILMSGLIDGLRIRVHSPLCRRQRPHGAIVAESDSGSLESPVRRHAGGKPGFRAPDRILSGIAGEYPADRFGPVYCFHALDDFGDHRATDPGSNPGSQIAFRLCRRDDQATIQDGIGTEGR